jgi:hypothetical protein
MRKEYQRKLNKKIKELNKAIEVDPLWLGRFEARQIKARWEQFFDNSGGNLHVIIRMVDKKTGYYHDYCLDYAPYYRSMDWHINMDIANQFIVEDLKVWEHDRPRDNVVDWIGVKVDESIFKKEYNFYENIEYLEGGRYLC